MVILRIKMHKSKDLLNVCRSLLISGMLLFAMAVPNIVAQPRYVGSLEEGPAGSGIDGRVFTLWEADSGRSNGHGRRTLRLIDSAVVLGNMIGFRYAVDQSNVYWLFRLAGGFADDSIIVLLKFRISENGMGPGERHEIPVRVGGSTCDCEFVRRGDRERLECPYSNVWLDLPALGADSGK